MYHFCSTLLAMSQKDMNDIKKAIAAIDAKKKVTASFVRGGSPGLVQQRLKKYPNSTSNIGIKKEIKETCKMHGEDLVLMEIGAYFKIIEEDAEYFHKDKEFHFKYTETREDYLITGFPSPLIDSYKQKLINRKINFCIVEEVFKEKGRNIIREVTFSSSNKSSLGLIFTGGVKT